jgi:hypothetical protein
MGKKLFGEKQFIRLLWKSLPLLFAQCVTPANVSDDRPLLTAQ